jgi:penicillin-binding protein 1A
MSLPPSTTRRRPAAVLRRLPRPVRAFGALLLALGMVQLAAQAAFAHPAAERWLRTRIADALAARVGGEVALGPDVDVDALYRVTFGPIDAGAPAEGVAGVHVDRAKVRPRWSALLAGRVEPATIRLHGIRVELEPGRATDARASAPPTPRGDRAPPSPRGEAGFRLRASGCGQRRPGSAEACGLQPEAFLSAFPVVHLRELELSLRTGGRVVALAPVDGRISGTRAAGGDVVELALWRGRASAEATIRRDAAGALSLDGRLARVPVRRIPPELLGAVATLLEGELSGELHVRAPADFAVAEVAFRLDAARLTVEGAALGPAPIGPFDAALSGRLSLDRAARELRLEEGALELVRALHVRAEGSARLAPGIPITLALRADAVDYRALVDGLPAALALPRDAPRPGGTFDVGVELGGPILRPSEWTVAGGLELARLRAAARREPAVALRRTFAHRPEADPGPAPSFRVGPENPGFVPYAELPPHVVRAVTLSEDAGFFAHQGFDLEELKNAFAAGAERGRVVRGGSTISQQLAKNLFLTREKTLARKIREAVLTIGLEATVPKARLLEIYLNVAEWGPGLHGIGPAARHYFGVDARALTPKQAAFLASIIPNPVRYHGMYARGALTEGWEQKVAELLLRMSEYGVLSNEELLAALAEPIVFVGTTTTAAEPG